MEGRTPVILLAPTERRRAVASESCGNRTTLHCCSFCELTPPALDLVTPSRLDLLIGSPQAAFAQRIYQ